MFRTADLSIKISVKQKTYTYFILAFAYNFAPVLTQLKNHYECIDNSASSRRVKMKHVPDFQLDWQQYSCKNCIHFCGFFLQTYGQRDKHSKNMF